MGKASTRNGGGGRLLAGLQDASKINKNVFRGVFRDASRRLLKRSKVEEEGGAHLLSSPSKVRRDNNSTRASTAPAQAQSSALGKRKRPNMVHEITIHEDNSATQAFSQPVQPAGFQVMANENMQWSEEDEDEDEDDEELEIDETVAEDMQKLEDNFKGISEKYRLINRIGEGMLVSPETRVQLLIFCRHIFHRLQSRTA